MKKFISLMLCVLLTLGISVTAIAADLGTCSVDVESVAADPGDIVTVAVWISDNPGFTNFAIALEYDHTYLTLKSLNTSEQGAPYLCGSNVSVNPGWETSAEATLGYVVAASENPVRGDGILFTATFEVKEGFVGQTQITPDVQYIRNNEAVFSIFEQIDATVTSGTVTAGRSADVNGDGIVEYDDVVLAYRAYLGEAVLTRPQLAVVDRNGNGAVEESEYKAIYQAYIGG